MWRGANMFGRINVFQGKVNHFSSSLSHTPMSAMHFPPPETTQPFSPAPDLFHQKLSPSHHFLMIQNNCVSISALLPLPLSFFPSHQRETPAILPMICPSPSRFRQRASFSSQINQEKESWIWVLKGLHEAYFIIIHAHHDEDDKQHLYKRGRWI